MVAAVLIFGFFQYFYSIEEYLIMWVTTFKYNQPVSQGELKERYSIVWLWENVSEILILNRNNRSDKFQLPNQKLKSNLLDRSIDPSEGPEVSKWARRLKGVKVSRRVNKIIAYSKPPATWNQNCIVSTAINGKRGSMHNGHGPWLCSSKGR